MRAKGTLTVTLNASVDVSYVVDRFSAGRTNRVREVTRVAGGRGNNVARVLASFGLPVVATGVVAGESGRFIRQNLQQNGIPNDFEEIGGESRTCISIIDPVGHTLTEVREEGPDMSPEIAERFLARYERLLSDVDLVVLSGSLPPGIPEDFYARLVRIAFRKYQIRCIVDATGPALREAARVQPYMVKPNLEELEEWVGRPLRRDDEILEAARKLHESGPLVVAVSLGARGLLLVSPEGAWRAVPPLIIPVNTIGCGDSLVAGMAAGLMQGLPAEAVLSLAVACGTSSALTPGVATLLREDLERIRPLVKVARVYL